MGVSSLVKKAEENLKIMTVKLPDDLIVEIRNIRKATGFSNTKVYSELLKEGVSRFKKASNGRTTQRQADDSGAQSG